MEGNYTLVKEKACAECYDHSAERDRCICWSERDYETVEIEFKQCNCCGNIDHDNIPYTPFNRQQLGDRFFEDEIAEEALQAKILVLTCIDEFPLFYLLPDDRIEHWKFIADTVIMDSDVKAVNLEIE